MPRPTADSSTGWWFIRIRLSDGKRKKYPLMKQPGWTKDRPKMPKKPPPQVELIARKYQDIDIQIKRGVDVRAASKTDLKGFLENYQADYAPDHAANSRRVLATAIGHFLSYCEGQGVKTLQAVSPSVCDGYMQARRKLGIARSTVHVEKGCLAPAWKKAVRDRLVAENPWQLAPLPGRAKPAKIYFWTKDELDKLINACNEGWLKDIVIVAVNLGGRITSILTLEWEAVHFERNTVLLDSKTGPYEVPMTEKARAVLEKLNCTSKSALVFPGEKTGRARKAATVYVAIRKVVVAAGIPEKGSYNHILRHTFASHALMAGIQLVTVSKWLGHKSIHMTLKYSHLCPEESQRQIKGFSLGPDIDPPSESPVDPKPHPSSDGPPPISRSPGD